MAKHSCPMCKCGMGESKDVSREKKVEKKEVSKEKKSMKRMK